MSILVSVDGILNRLDPSLLGADERIRIARDGVFHYPNRHPMSGAAAARARAYFASAPALAGATPLGMLTEDEAGRERWLIPGLWVWGTVPMLGGAPKVGKSTLGADLIASLTVPGRRFLDHFPATEYEDLHVRVINAETRPADYEACLLAAGAPGVADDRPNFAEVTIDHLELLNGPQGFDLTVQANYDEWQKRLVKCFKCDGYEFFVPDVVIVDGATAILLAAGKGVDQVGAWFAAFRRLMRSIGVENALVIGHSTQKGDHLMGGVEALAGPDGLWNYDNARRFSVTPRLGGVRVLPEKVELCEDERLRIRPAIARRGTMNESNSGSRLQETMAAIQEFVSARETTGSQPTTREIVSRIPGSAEMVHAALKEMCDEDSNAATLTRTVRNGRGGGFVYGTQARSIGTTVAPRDTE